MAKLKHIKRTVDKHGWTQWSAPELLNARVWKPDGCSWRLTIKRIDLLQACLYRSTARTLEQMDDCIERIICMSNHELVERAYHSKARAFDLMANDKDGYDRRSPKLWSDRADLVMLLYRDRVNQHVDGQVSLAAE
jgi:hypothetical protein